MFRKSVAYSLLVVLFCCFGVLAKSDPYSQMALELSGPATLLKQNKVAILPFNYMDNRESKGGMIIAERLTTRIVRHGKLQVVERQLLEKVLDELRFGTSGIVDVTTTKKLGKVLGVDAIITGTLIDLKRNKVEVNARLINTETAQVLATSTVEIKKIWSDAPTRSPLTPPSQIAQPVAQQSSYGQKTSHVSPTTYRQTPEVAMFADFFIGTTNAIMDLTFSNTSNIIDEFELSFDLDGSGWLDLYEAYNEVSFSDLETETSAIPIGARIGLFLNPSKPGLSVGFDFEMSYSEHNIKKQSGMFTLNGTRTSSFEFFVDDYLNVKVLNLLSGDVLLQYNGTVVRPYAGVGLGLTLNTVSSPWIFEETGALNETVIGFLYRFPIGVRVILGETASLFAEYRYSHNGFTFTRGITGESDTVGLFMNSLFFGAGVQF